MELENLQETVTTLFTKHQSVYFLKVTQVPSLEENQIKMSMSEKWKEAKFHHCLGDNLILKICGLIKISLFKQRLHKFIESIFQTKEAQQGFQKQRT